MELALRGVLTVVLMHVAAVLASPAAVILDVDASSFFQYGLDVDDDLAVRIHCIALALSNNALHW